jgi:hypothetical protein
VEDATFYAAIAQILPVFILAIAVQGELMPNFLRLGLRERAARLDSPASMELVDELDRITEAEQEASDRFYALESPSHEEFTRFRGAEIKADAARTRLLWRARLDQIRVDKTAERASAMLTMVYLVIFVLGEIVALAALSAERVAFGWLSVFATFLAFGCVLVPVFHRQISLLTRSQGVVWQSRNFVAACIPALVGLCGALTVTP